MGVCNSKKSSSTPIQSTMTQSANKTMDINPPPDLHRKSAVSTVPITSIKTKRDLFLLITSHKLNETLEKGGNLQDFLGSVLNNNQLKESVVNDSICEIFETIMNQKKLISCYNSKNLIEKILKEFESYVYGSFLKIENRNFYILSPDANFITHVLFSVTLIFQILITYKKNVVTKKNDIIQYWWLPPAIKPNDTYSDNDTYNFVKKQIVDLNRVISLQLANKIVKKVDSETIVYFSGQKLKEESAEIAGDRRN